MKLKTLREDMRPKVTQEMVARKANLPLSTYIQAETGDPVHYSTVRPILAALNQLRRDPKWNLPKLTLDDLELNIV